MAGKPRPAAVGGGTPRQLGAVAGAGTNAGIPKPPKRASKVKANTLTVMGGRREMKAYTVTGDELLSLGLVQGGSAFAFAFAGSCIGFWLSVKQGIELAGKDTAANAISKWQAYGDVAFYAAVGFALIAFGLTAFSGWRVRQIRKGTIHD